MSEATAADPAVAAPPRRSSSRAILMALPVALLAGGGAFYVAWSGLLPIPAAQEPGLQAGAPAIAHVPLRGLVVTVGRPGAASQLIFSADIEVPAEAEREVSALMPRFIDVLNGYLRALEPEELQAPAALARLRAQMLRRLQIVAGEGAIRDLLIIEFVLR